MPRQADQSGWEKKKAEREELERQQRLAELEVSAREDVVVAG